MSLVLEGRAYNNFIDSLKSDFTKKTYNYHLKRFMNNYKKHTLDSFLKLPITEIEQLIISYLVKSKTEVSTPHIKIGFAAIKHLCVMNDVRINERKIGKFLGEPSVPQENRAYTHEEIQKLLNVCDLRMRMVILLLASTGMRIGALPTLKIRDTPTLKDAQYHITVYSGTKEKYTTFMTPECRHALDAYLEYRTRSGEKLEPDSPLIREQFDINDFEQIRKRCKPISRNTLANLLHHLIIKAGLKQVYHNFTGRERHDVPMAHGFRKFFSTQLVEADLKTELRWMLEGHALKANDFSYVKPTTEQLAHEYTKAIDLLTIEPSQRLQKKLTEVTTRNDRLEKALDKIDRLEKELGLTV